MSAIIANAKVQASKRKHNLERKGEDDGVGLNTDRLPKRAAVGESAADSRVWCTEPRGPTQRNSQLGEFELPDDARTTDIFAFIPSNDPNRGKVSAAQQSS